MLDADAVINNSFQKVGGSNTYPDPAPKKWVGPDPEKHIGSTPLVAGLASITVKGDGETNSVRGSITSYVVGSFEDRSSV